jgi:hypothetical protein
MNLSKISTKDLEYINAGQFDKVSTAGLEELTKQQEATITPSVQQAQPRTAGQEFVRGAGLATRGAAPVAAGAGLGFMVGGPPGALAGSLALPLAEMGTQAANVILPQNYQIPSPYSAVEGLLTQLGLPVPETTRERMVQAGGGALGGASTQLAALPSIAKTATTELGRGLAGQMAVQPGRQLAAAAPSAMVGQKVGEDYGPVAGMLAGTATSLPFSMGLKPREVDVIPTTEELKATAGKLYKFADDSGVSFKKNAFQSFATKTAAELRKEGVDPTLSPKANAALQRLEDAATQPITLSELDRLRRVALISAMSSDAADRNFGGQLIQRIDDFIENASPNQFRVQDPKAIEALKEARQLWKQGKKSQILENIFNVAELRAETNFTQSGMEQALRSRLTNLAVNEKLMRSFSKTEQQAIRDAAKGGSMQNFFRYVGKLAPTSVIPAAGGFVLGQQAFGPEAGGLTMAIPAITGATSRGIATSQGLQRYSELEKMLRLGRQPRTAISGKAPVVTCGLISSQEPVSQEELNLLNLGR